MPRITGWWVRFARIPLGGLLVHAAWIGVQFVTVDPRDTTFLGLFLDPHSGLYTVWDLYLWLAGSVPDGVQLQLRQGQGVLPLPRLSGGGGGMPGEPGLQFGDRPGEVHGTIRGQRTPGGGPGAGPPSGHAGRQWRPRHLHRTCKEASEARMDALGSGFGTAETGACSAAPAGEAETPAQSGPGCSWWGWPVSGPVGRPRVRVPGGAALNSWGGGAAPAAFSEKADDSCVAKVNHFYYGWSDEALISPTCGSPDRTQESKCFPFLYNSLCSYPSSQ